MPDYRQFSIVRQTGKLLINAVTNFVIMLSSVLVTGNYILGLGFKTLSDISDHQLVYIIYAIFMCSAVWVFGKKIVGTMTDFLFEKLRAYGENALFNITKGDKNKQVRVKSKEKASRIVILGNILLTIFINILCGIIVNTIS